MKGVQSTSFLVLPEVDAAKPLRRLARLFHIAESPQDRGLSEHRFAVRRVVAHRGAERGQSLAFTALAHEGSPEETQHFGSRTMCFHLPKLSLGLRHSVKIE